MVCLTLKEGYQRIEAQDVREQLYKEPGVTAKGEAEYSIWTGHFIQEDSLSSPYRNQKGRILPAEMKGPGAGRPEKKVQRTR